MTPIHDIQTRQTIVRLLSSMGSAKEIDQYLRRFAQLDAERFAVVKVGGAVLRDDLDAIDSVDEELFPIFQEEALELLPQLASRMRDWAERPSDPAGASACMRTLHTLKGGARLAGAMRLGELSHRLETAIEQLSGREHTTADDIEALFARVDAIGVNFEALWMAVMTRLAIVPQSLYAGKKMLRPGAVA